MHDRNLARRMRNAVTAIPQHIATRDPERMVSAHGAAARVIVMLDVARAWGYVHDDDIAEAQHAAGQVHGLTAP